MATGKRGAKGGRDGGVDWGDDGAQGDAASDPSDYQAQLAALFDGLDDSAEVMIERVEPAYAAGFIGTWEVFDRDPASFMARLQAECGGHVYRVRPLRREVNGRKLYGRGMKRIRIAGPPLVEGRRWGTDEGPPVIDTTARVQPHPPPHPPAMQHPMGQFVEALNGIVTRLGALEAQSRAIANPQPTIDPMAQMLATMKGFAELQKVWQGLAPGGVAEEDDDDDDDDDEPPNIETMIAQIIAKKFDSDGEPKSPAPASTPAPAPNTTPGPRLIRSGVDVTDQGATTTGPAAAPSSTASPPPPASGHSPQEAAEGARQVAGVLARLPADEAVAFLVQTMRDLPPEVQSGLQAAALAELQSNKAG